MGYVIIRQAPDTDEYVIWDAGSERPVAVGTRDEIARDAAELEPDRDDLDERLAHTDLHGSSMVPYPLGWWDDAGLIYQQRGVLPRARLAEAARLFVDGRETAVDELLQPFAPDPDQTGDDPRSQPDPEAPTAAAAPQVMVRRAVLAGDVLAAAERWQTGDIVLAADRQLWCRAEEQDAAQGWPWAYVDGWAPRHAGDGVPEGSVPEQHPVRPLILLLRAGTPVAAGPPAEPDPDADAQNGPPDTVRFTLSRRDGTALLAMLHRYDSMLTEHPAAVPDDERYGTHLDVEAMITLLARCSGLHAPAPGDHDDQR